MGKMTQETYQILLFTILPLLHLQIAKFRDHKKTKIESSFWKTLYFNSFPFTLMSYGGCLSSVTKRHKENTVATDNGLHNSSLYEVLKMQGYSWLVNWEGWQHSYRVYVEEVELVTLHCTQMLPHCTGKWTLTAPKPITTNRRCHTSL